MYRQPDQITDLDLEARAAEAADSLHALRRELRTQLTIVGVVAAAVAGLLTALALQEPQGHMPPWLQMSSLAGIGATVAVLLATVPLTRLVVATATPAWIDELSLRHRVPRTRLEELERELRSLG